MLHRAFTVLLLCAAVRIQAQACAGPPVPIFVGSEWERYVRTLQVVGAVAPEPWTIRGLTPRQWRDLVPSDSTLPWAREQPGFVWEACSTQLRAGVLPATGRLTYNS